MTHKKNFIYKSLTYKYFGAKLFKNKNLRNALLSLEEILIIKKNIKKIFNTDDPNKIEQLLGCKVNDVIIKPQDIKYSKLIDDTYQKIYTRCKNILGDTSDNNK